MANWLSGYTTRRKITIDKSKIDSTLTDFPVLVKLTSSNFDFSKANSDGYDVRFTSDNGTTLLKYERERHDATNKLAEYWVKIPSISSTANTEFYIYYRTTDTTDGADPTNVWDSNFKGVWHMKDLTTSTIEDSTSNNNDGTKKNANEPIQADGQIAKAQDFDGTDDYITVGTMGNFGSELATNKPTFSCWVKSSVTNKVLSLCGTANDGTTVFFDIKLNCYWDDTVAAGKIRVLLRDKDGKAVSGYVDSNTGITNGNWHHLVVTIDGSNNAIQIILDGVSQSVTYYFKNTPSSFVNFQYPMAIGARNNRGTLDYHFDGIIDEVSFSNTLRPFAWIKASYNSGNNSLVSYGNEEEGIDIDNAVFFGCNF